MTAAVERRRREWRIELREAAIERKALKERIALLEDKIERERAMYETALDKHRQTIEWLLTEKRALKAD